MVSTGVKHTLAIDIEGNLLSWGYNGFGQLGDGTEDNRTTPVVPVSSNSSKWQTVKAGTWISMTIAENGSLFSFGSGSDGMMGIGRDVFNQRTPLRIGSYFKWKSISIGSRHVIGLTNDNHITGWGWNEDGQLGDETTKNKNSPQLCGTKGGEEQKTTGGSQFPFFIILIVAVFSVIGAFVYFKRRKDAKEAQLTHYLSAQA